MLVYTVSQVSGRVTYDPLLGLRDVIAMASHMKADAVSLIHQGHRSAVLQTAYPTSSF